MVQKFHTFYLGGNPPGAGQTKRTGQTWLNLADWTSPINPGAPLVRVARPFPSFYGWDSP